MISNQLEELISSLIWTTILHSNIYKYQKRVINITATHSTLPPLKFQLHLQSKFTPVSIYLYYLSQNAPQPLHHQ